MFAEMPLDNLNGGQNRGTRRRRRGLAMASCNGPYDEYDLIFRFDRLFCNIELKDMSIWLT
jgi:hypothetical protein